MLLKDPSLRWLKPGVEPTALSAVSSLGKESNSGDFGCNLKDIGGALSVPVSRSREV